MSRTKFVRKVRAIDADPVYGSKLISKIVNCSMHDGKKDVAAKGIYGAIALISPFIEDEYKKSHTEEGEQKKHTQMVAWFVEAVINKIAPSAETRSRRIGGANYQIPIALSPKRRLGLAIRWLIEGARLRKERGMSARFAAEMRDAIQEKGEAIKKRDTVHKTAEANKAFAHYGVNG